MNASNSNNRLRAKARKVLSEVLKVDLDISKHRKHKVFGIAEDDFAYYCYCGTCHIRLGVLKDVV